MADALSASRSLQLPAAPPPRLPLHRSLRRLPLLARSELPKSFPAPATSSIPPPRRSWTAAAAATSWNGVEEGAKATADNDAPSSIQLLPLASEEEFDRVIADEPVVVLWMAKWCRKCIYLKPKLEKLAADYHPRIRFYCVDVNAVPQRLVSRAGITAPGSIAIDAKAILKRTSDVRRGAGGGGGSMYELDSSLMRMV